VADSPSSFLDLLDLRQVGDSSFEGLSPDPTRYRVFGGQPLAQGLVAAGRTVPSDRRVHSLHATYLRPGDAQQPLRYDVTPLSDGRSFSVRRVEAWQGDRQVFVMLASFQPVEEGLEHQWSAPAGMPEPEDLSEPERPTDPATRSRMGIQTRLVGDRPTDGVAVPPDRAPGRIWFRAGEPLPDDHLVHAAVLAFASDMALLAVSGIPQGRTLSDPGLLSASIDHAMWFHRDVRVDEWLLHDLTSPSMGGSRALTQGRVYRRDGALVASTSQEGMVRQVGPLGGVRS
jgi:acyl-CoA thioesterase-2